MFIVNEHAKIMNNIELCKEMGMYFDGEIKNFPTEISSIRKFSITTTQELALSQLLGKIMSRSNIL
jgi:hypothetical protein